MPIACYVPKRFSAGSENFSDGNWEIQIISFVNFEFFGLLTPWDFILEGSPD